MNSSSHNQIRDPTIDHIRSFKNELVSYYCLSRLIAISVATWTNTKNTRNMLLFIYHRIHLSYFVLFYLLSTLYSSDTGWMRQTNRLDDTTRWRDWSNLFGLLISVDTLYCYLKLTIIHRRDWVHKKKAVHVCLCVCCFICHHNQSCRTGWTAFK